MPDLRLRRGTSIAKAFQLFLHYQLEALEDCQRRLQQQESLLRDYVGLRTRLSTIAEQARYSAVIPIGPHAVVRGELVHTNEILVFLGDNYFAERSSKQVRLTVCFSGRLIDWLTKQESLMLFRARVVFRVFFWGNWFLI